MRFILQQYSTDKDKPCKPGIFIELTTEGDIPELLREGVIRLPLVDSGGEVLHEVCVFLKGRGISAGKL